MSVGADLHSTNRRRNFQPIFPIPVKDEELRSRCKWKCFPQLLNDPFASWMGCDVEVNDPPPTVADDEEAIDHAEGDRWYREEIHCRDSFSMAV